ncbi:MAG: putative transcriptional regulator [Myxococcaceae bacterium]|nr:putative transcriptional regulator [Myxococcaceae bacterium]
MALPSERGLSGKRVAIFESRFKDEFANLVRKQGAEPLVGPTMAEAPLELGPELRQFAAALRDGQVDALLVLTGVGNRKLVTLLAPIMSKEELSAELAKIVVVARGPKAVQALRELGNKPQVVAPEPHTWQTLLEALRGYMPLAGKRIALQQYGVPHERLTEALSAGGAEVMQVPVYRWQLPEDTKPLELVIDQICAGTVDAILFTSGPQAGVLIDVAQQRGQEASLRAALSRVALGSVGPSCTEAMRNLELEPDFEPEHGKMGHLVLEAARKVPLVLARKRQG